MSNKIEWLGQKGISHLKRGDIVKYSGEVYLVRHGPDSLGDVEIEYLNSSGHQYSWILERQHLNSVFPYCRPDIFNTLLDIFGGEECS